AVCAEKTEALCKAFACGWNSIDFFNYQPGRQAGLSCGRFWIDFRNPERVRLVEIKHKSETNDRFGEFVGVFTLQGQSQEQRPTNRFGRDIVCCGQHHHAPALLLVEANPRMISYSLLARTAS